MQNPGLPNILLPKIKGWTQNLSLSTIRSISSCRIDNDRVRSHWSILLSRLSYLTVVSAQFLYIINQSLTLLAIIYG